jgi:hypothetical protein
LYHEENEYWGDESVESIESPVNDFVPEAGSMPFVSAQHDHACFIIALFSYVCTKKGEKAWRAQARSLAPDLCLITRK